MSIIRGLLAFWNGAGGRRVSRQDPPNASIAGSAALPSGISGGSVVAPSRARTQCRACVSKNAGTVCSYPPAQAGFLGSGRGTRQSIMSTLTLGRRGDFNMFWKGRRKLSLMSLFSGYRAHLRAPAAAPGAGNRPKGRHVSRE